MLKSIVGENSLIFLRGCLAYYEQNAAVKTRRFFDFTDMNWGYYFPHSAYDAGASSAVRAFGLLGYLALLVSKTTTRLRRFSDYPKLLASVSRQGTSTRRTIRLSAFPPFRLSAFPPFRLSAFPPFRLSAFPPFRLSAFPPFRLSAFPPFRLSAFPPFRLSDFQTFRLSDFQTFRLSDFQTFRPICFVPFGT
jgi:hypothetical protein